MKAGLVPITLHEEVRQVVFVSLVELFTDPFRAFQILSLLLNGNKSSQSLFCSFSQTFLPERGSRVYIYIYLRTWFFKARSSRIYSKYAVGLTWEISTLRNNPPSPANQAPFELVPFPMMLQEWDGFHPASWIRQKLLHYRM